DQRDEVRVAPVAVAGQAHGLPGRSIDGQRRGTGEAALGVEADGAGGERGRRPDRAEQLLGRRGLRLGGLGGRLLGRGLLRRSLGRLAGIALLGGGGGQRPIVRLGHEKGRQRQQRDKAQR